MDEKGDIRNIYEHIDCLCGLTFAVEIKKKQTVRKLPFISSSFLTRVIPTHCTNTQGTYITLLQAVQSGVKHIGKK